MPNPKDNRLYLRLPGDLKSRLEVVAEKMQQQSPEGDFSASSIVRAAIEQKVAELEKKLKIKK